MEIIQKKKTSVVVQPQVFGLLIEFPENSFISVQCAYSLEEAFALAKMEYEEQNASFGKRETFAGAKINLFAIKTLDEIQNAPSLREVIEKSEERIKGQMSEALNIFKRIDENTLKNTSGISPTQPDFVAPLRIPLNDAPAPKKAKPLKLTKIQKNKLMKQIVKDKDKDSFEKNKSFFTLAEQSYLLEKLK
jgi:hypothetical protein